VIGAGAYADQRYGACACTHTGEMTIRAGTARAVVLALRRGAPLEEACHEAIADLRDLRGGLLGAVAVHAIDARGRACVVCTPAARPEMTYCLWREGMAAPDVRPADAPR
jgi:L-asparaginase